jgi:hypothetical protein
LAAQFSGKDDGAKGVPLHRTALRQLSDFGLIS